MPDDIISRGLIKTTEGVKNFINNSLIGAVILNISFKGALFLILGMINSLQLILHLPIMNIVIPANVMTMFTILIPVVMFDITEELDLLSRFFPENTS